jgi:flagellar biosynthesis chaperone FliJ
MKRFAFPLERVLAYRRSQADLEQAKLVNLETELKKLREELNVLQASFAEEVRNVRPNPVDRAELGRYRMVVETQTIRIEQRMREKVAQVERQKQVYVKANQAAEVLVKVKDKQKKNWEKELQKELDSLAMDSYLARWKN